MNILLSRLPEYAEIGGKLWLVNSDYRFGINFELIMRNTDLPPQKRVEEALALFYPEIPPDISEAMNQMLIFYACGEVDEGKAKVGAGKRACVAYCFEQDADLILAAFWQSYGIDLSATDMHWWKFRALFSGLPSECRLAEIMGYRVADLAGMSKKQKKHYERMKKLYAIKNKGDISAALTLAERDRKMKEYVAKRFAESNKGGELSGV